MSARPPIAAASLLLTATLLVCVPVRAQPSLPRCAPDNAGLTLPEGFCALIVADGIGAARHLTVAANGDVFVATARSRDPEGGETEGGVVVLRDRNGDGVADDVRRFGGGSGEDVSFQNGYLYFSTDAAVVRYRWRNGALEPVGAADTVVSGLPATGSHRPKSMAFGGGGELYVNIGSPGNVCQIARDDPRGQDPCPELETRAGIWMFDANRLGQRQSDGVRFATGLRNTVALTVRPQDGRLYGAVNGRDRLNGWPIYDDQQSAEKPSEEFVQIDRGDDFGWPYCFFDGELGHKVLAPEYGGDGTTVGRCAGAKAPLIGFPAHWAPLGILFYSGTQFPARYRGGAFIAFHGSWNRAPMPQAGYLVAFAPFDGNAATGEYEVFADGFAGADKSPGGAAHRPVGVAQGPDGSLYVADDRNGRVYRIVYPGGR